MNKIILSLLLIIGISNFISCQKKENPDKESLYTLVEVTVENEKGEKISSQYVKMFDEKTYSMFKDNHQTKAQAESITNKDGKATFTLENSKWFDGKSSIELMFAVLELIDQNNYTYSSKGGTVKKNSNAKFTIIFPSKTPEIPSDQVLVIEDNILKGITDNNLTSIVLPENVKEIANNVFERSNITEITLNNGVEKIGEECFLKSKIKKINFPSSLKEIGKAAFQDCTNLESIDLSNTQIEIIPESAFLDSGLKDITLPKNIKKISGESFSGTENMRNITINESIKEIGSRAFYKSGLTDITLPNSLNKIGYMAFADCFNLTKIDKTSETSANEGLIDVGAFQNCTSLSEVILPDNITRIEGYTFIECAKLNKLSLPKSLKSIGEQGLRTNYDIGTIIFNSTQIPDFTNENGNPIFNVLPFFDNINGITVPQQSVDDYKNRWTLYSQKIKGI